MTKRRIISIGICTISIVMLVTGCKKKKAVEEAVESPVIMYTEEEYMALDNKLKQKDNELAIYDERYKTIDAFKKKSVVQAGSWDFNKINDKIVLNGAAVSPLTNSSVESNGLASAIILGDGKVKIDATDWTVQTNTSEVNFSIPEKACGRIKTFKYIDSNFEYNRIKYDWLEPFLTENGLEMQSEREIYQKEIKVGHEVTANISILDSTENGFKIKVPASSIFEEESLDNWNLNPDSEISATLNIDEDKRINAELRVGLVNSNGLLLYYEFLNFDKSGKRFIDNLINSISINDKMIYLK